MQRLIATLLPTGLARRLLSVLLAAAAATTVGLVATEGTGNAYNCGLSYCSSLERVADGTEGLGAIWAWHGYGSVLYKMGSYDRKLPYGVNTHWTWGWGTTQGFYVGVHYRAHVYAINTGGGIEDRGWFNRGQYRLNFPYDYVVDEVYNCSC